MAALSELSSATATEIIDVDELEEALNTGQITPEHCALAWAEARAVQAALEGQTFAPVDIVRAYLHTPAP